MTVLRIGTYNLYEYGRERTEDARRRYRQVADVIAELDCDVVAVQEVCGRGRVELEHLAREAEMSCWYDPPWVDAAAHKGQVAIAGTEPRPSDFHVGLLWRERQVRTHPSAFLGYPGGGELWHGLAMLEFEVDGLTRPLHVGSYHGTPFQKDGRPDEARRIVSALTRPYGDRRLAIVGADWNSISADRVQDADGHWTHWHHDPYWSERRDNTWAEAYGYQTFVLERGHDGLPTRWCADRRPGEVLRDAGCRDAAALASAPWAPSVGHFDHADMGYRCIDTHRVSPSLTPAVIGWEVIDTEAARVASDHLPVVTTLDLSRLPGNQ